MAKTGPERQVTDERLMLEIVINPDPAVFASEIEENVPISRQRVTGRLDDLEEKQFVYSKRASGRRLWWLTQKGRERVEERAREAIESVD